MSDKNKNICYICMEIPLSPIYPAGCTHCFCKNHLKVNKFYIIIIILEFKKIRMWSMPFTF